VQERLIREMVKLRGGPTKLKALSKEYEEQINQLWDRHENLVCMRNLILELISADDEPSEADREEES